MRYDCCPGYPGEVWHLCFNNLFLISFFTLFCFQTKQLEFLKAIRVRYSFVILRAQQCAVAFVIQEEPVTGALQPMLF